MNDSHTADYAKPEFFKGPIFEFYKTGNNKERNFHNVEYERAKDNFNHGKKSNYDRYNKYAKHQEMDGEDEEYYEEEKNYGKKRGYDNKFDFKYEKK